MSVETRTAIVCDRRRDGRCRRELVVTGNSHDAHRQARKLGWFRSVAPVVHACPPCSGEPERFTHRTPLFIPAVNHQVARLIAHGLQLAPHQWQHLRDVDHQLRGYGKVFIARAGGEGAQDPTLEAMLRAWRMDVEWIDVELP